MKNALKAAWPPLLIVSLVVALFHKVLRLWWMFDDPFQLTRVRDVALGSLLTSKEFYGGSSVFTPLLILSLKLDSALFGTHAAAFYGHQLVSVAAALVAEYFLLRLWCAPVPALAAVVATIAGAPLLQIVPELMCRHYVEGALFAFLATIAFVRGQPWLSAAAYFLAACAKEIFLPLPLLLLAIPTATPATRLHALRGHVVAAVVYAAWRLYAVGLDLGSYGLLAQEGQRLKTILALPWTVVRELAGSGGAVRWVCVAAVAASAIFVFVRRPAARWPIAAAILLSLLPLVPLAAAIERRYAFALWLCAAMAVAFLPRAWAAVAVAAVALVAFRVEWPPAYRDLLRMSDEARVLSMLRQDDVLRNPLTQPTTMVELARLTGTQAHAYYDELHLCDPKTTVGRIFEYDPARREVVETSRATLDRVCASIVEKPMSVQFHFDREHALDWKLGPYTDGRWSFVIAEGIVAYDVTAQGAFRRPGWDQFRMRARYIAPQGWRTYSPLLPVDSRIPLTVWRR